VKSVLATSDLVSSPVVSNTPISTHHKLQIIQHQMQQAQQQQQIAQAQVFVCMCFKTLARLSRPNFIILSTARKSPESPNGFVQTFCNWCLPLLITTYVKNTVKTVDGFAGREGGNYCGPLVSRPLRINVFNSNLL